MPAERLSRCELFDTLGWALQFTLGVAALMILVVKWRLEPFERRRSKSTFLLDFSKQVIYSVIIHALNLMFASTMGDVVRKQDGPCNWYGQVQALGVTVGLIITIVLLQLGKLVGVEGVKDSGMYGSDPEKPELNTYCIQLWVWVALVTVQRLLLFALMFLARHPLGNFGNWLFADLKHDGKKFAFIVLVIIPILTSIIEYWIQDDVLMAVSGVSPKKSASSNRALSLEETTSLLDEPVAVRDDAMSSPISRTTVGIESQRKSD